MKKIFLLAISSYCFIVGQTLDINSLRMAQLKQGVNDINPNGVSTVKQSEAKILIDKPIDEQKYIIGPGDEFNINIISSEDISTYNIVVSPSGKALIPSIGVIVISGLSLAEALKEIELFIQKINPNAKIHILLSQIRKFKIKVIGQLQKPGFYTVTPVSRVSDIYEEILADLNESENERSLNDMSQRKLKNLDYPELSTRNITILRDKDSLKVDLLKFGSNGNDLNNPVVKQGDVVSIPLMNHIVGIFGGIKIPGNYEFVKGENLAELIKLSGGLRSDADSNKIEITRFKSPIEKYTFSTNLKEAHSVLLYPEDHIMVRYEKNFKRQDIVNISGEVKYPGLYSIEVGKTKIGEVLKKAGGYTSKADRTKLFINNRSISSIPDREKNRILIIPEENRSAEEKAYIKARMLTKKGTIESTSLSHAQSLMNLNVTKNDRIMIPENFNYIEVLGAVLKPGRYPFDKSIQYEGYLDLAGGITNTATRKRFIIKAGTGQRLRFNKSVSIENGDTIFIPDEIEYNRWIVFKDILTVLGNMAALILVIQNVTIGN